jgi:hypothetical protein
LERSSKNASPATVPTAALASLVPTPGELRVETKMKTVTAVRKVTRVT